MDPSAIEARSDPWRSSPSPSPSPDSEVEDLVARVRNTRWPEDVVPDWSRGVPTAYARKLAAYWADEFDWRAQEAELNAFPQFTTDVDGQTDPLRPRAVRRAGRHARC